MKRRKHWMAGSVSLLLAASMIGGCGAGADKTASAQTTAAAAVEGTRAAASAEPAENRAVSGEAAPAAGEVAPSGAAETWAAEAGVIADAGGSSPQAVITEADGAMADNRFFGMAPGAPGSRASMARKYEAVYGPGQDRNQEEYRYFAENGYKDVAQEPLSTFSVDVDTAAYSNIRRMIRSGEEIPADAVRIEEMINYFPYDYPEPKAGEPFSVSTEYGDCPWNEDHRLLLIGLKAKEIDFSRRPQSNFVFLLDVSGSMYSQDKLPLVQKSFAMLTENLTEADRVSIVAYAGYESVVLDGVSGEEKALITAALEDLEAGGSTAGEAGIRMAYDLARKHYIPGGNNRVILATDGDLNVGISSEGELIRLIEEQKQSGVHLSVLGVGSGNLKDNKLEALADHGDGNYNYLDSLFEAKKVLVDEMGGTLVTVAKDVKIQLEFNPQYVQGYRLVGYENRVLANEDFDNDKVDAGEIGSGHTVTALYEIIPADREGASRELKYQTQGTPKGSSELLTVSLRYKAPNGDTSRLLSYPVEADSYQEELPENLRFAAAVAEFGMILRDSEYRAGGNMKEVLELAESCINRDSDDYRKEFLALAEAYNNKVVKH